jgi:hypothetical protein
MPSFQEILFQKMHGRQIGEDVPYYQPMLDTAHKMSGSIMSLGSDIASAVKKEAKQAGIPSSYIWWLLLDKDEWPPMSAQQKSALGIALEIATRSGSVPDYSSSFETPSEDKEPYADLVIFDIAAWCSRVLMKAAHREIFKACKQYAPQIENAYGMSTAKSIGLLAKLVVHYAKNYPTTITNASLLRKIFSLLKLS